MSDHSLQGSNFQILCSQVNNAETSCALRAAESALPSPFQVVRSLRYHDFLPLRRHFAVLVHRSDPHDHLRSRDVCVDGKIISVP